MRVTLGVLLLLEIPLEMWGQMTTTQHFPGFLTNTLQGLFTGQDIAGLSVTVYVCAKIELFFFFYNRLSWDNDAVFFHQIFFFFSLSL